MNIKHVVTIAFAGTLAALLLASVGCSSSGGSVPTCAQAIDHLYAMGGTVAVNGSAVSKADALSGCNSLQSDIKTGTCACKSQLDATLTCINDQTQVGTCENEWSALDSCTANSNCPD
jgi:hypothetical protein